MTVAFVLGGGGLLGALEVGMLRALAEAGVRPDLVVGTSIGAINGAFVAADPPGAAARLSRMWQGEELRLAFTEKLWGRAVRLVRSGTHLHSFEPLGQLLAAALPGPDFADLKLPFQCVAAGIESASARWFASGPVVPAVMASCAVPGLLPPVEIDGAHYFDGGLVDSIPVGRAVALGATTVYVLQVGRIESPLEVPTRPWEVGLVAFEIARRHRFHEEMSSLPVDVRVHVLPTGGERLPALAIDDATDVQVGDLVLAIGDPFGVGQTVTHGIISALARTQVGITDYQFFIQTDAAINPGNSGGALVDMTGKLAGINTAIFSRSGGSQGIGFAIPANMVRVVVVSAKNGGKAVKRPWLGARLQAVTPEIAETLGLRLPSGALVSNVVPNSPAARAGLKLSDLIVAIDGQTVEDPNAFDYRFATRPLGGKSDIDVQRGGKAVKLSVPLETAPDTGRNEIVLTTRSPFQGAKVANISPAVADELHLDADTEGVVVTDLADGGTAASVGFQKGDIILAVNNQKIAKTSDLEKATRDTLRLWRITLVRGGQQINVTLGG